jgi:hypothetical protein
MGELSGSLLQVLTDPAGRSKQDGLPLWFDFPVNPALAPFLVSSTRGVLWVFPRMNRVRAAPRKIDDLGQYFRDVIEAVAEKGAKEEWGNIHELTKPGLEAAIDHVREHTLGEEDLEILANPQIDWGAVEPEWAVAEGDLPLALLGLPLQPAQWLPLDTVVVVPCDREFVGFVFPVLERMVSVVHNSCRTIAVARGRNTP